jgi:hypothetical protein
LVVAAFNSLNPAGANYVCDGVNDQGEIQAAIDALEKQGGGVLEFQKGTYRISSAGQFCLYLCNKLTLRGEGGALKEEVRLVLDYTNGEPEIGMFQTKGWRWPPPWVSVNNITFQNLTIDVGSPEGFLREYPEGVFWQDFFVIEATSDYLLIDNVRFMQSNPESVTSRLYLHECDHVTIQDCEFEGTVVYCYSNGRLLGQPRIMLNTGPFLFQRNVMRNTCIGQMALGGEMNYFTALDNRFYNCGDTAIDTALSTSALVERNEIYGARGYGIYSEGGHDVTIRNNIIEDVVYRNPKIPWDGFGIGTADARNYRMGGNVLIENNDITNCGNGISSRGTPGLTIRNNRISGMEMNGIGLSYLAEDGVNYDGIPSYADNCRIGNNTIVGFGKSYQWASGIVLHNVVGSEVKGNLVDGSNKPGSRIGINETFSQMCKCPSCGWVFGHDWSSGLPCDQRICPHCGASLQAYASQNRPDYSLIQDNTISGVIKPITTIGPHTIVSNNN